MTDSKWGGQSKGKSSRLIIFGDSNSFASRYLVKTALETARKKSIPVTLLCDTGFSPRLGRLLHYMRIRTAWAIWKIFEPKTAPKPPKSTPRFSVLSKRFGVPLLRAPGSTVNTPAFLERVCSVGVDWALCFLSLSIFSSELISLLKASVNYHNGSLPLYRGLYATSWSLYHGEPRTGFAFHYMARSIDAGRVLLQESIPIPGKAAPRKLDLEKAVQAGSRLPQVFDRVLSGDPGESQEGESRYFNRSAFEHITSIERPSELTEVELLRRVHAFEELRLMLNGKRYPVTRLRYVGNRAAGPLDFVTADGAYLRPTRFSHMPRTLYRFSRLVGGGAV